MIYNRAKGRMKALKCSLYEDLILMIEDILEEIFKHIVSINSTHDGFSESVSQH